MENKDKIILDLCGGTGAWSKPYKEAGYDVRLVTLPETDVRTYEPPENVYGILAAPPCTMFSKARSTAITPRDYKGAMETVAACLNIIWTCRTEHRIKFWALENPMGQLRQFLGKPPFSFQPWEYGDPYIKQTDLWGYFNMPKKTPVEVPGHVQEECLRGSRSGKYLPKLPDDYIPQGERSDRARRSITPEGFAKAFFRANK